MRLIILLLPAFWMACTDGTKPGIDSTNPTGMDSGGTTTDSQDTQDTQDTGTQAKDPDIVVDPLTVDLGVLVANAQGTATVSVQNKGTGDLNFSTTIDGGFAVDTTSGTVPPGGSTSLVVTFSSANNGSYTGTLTVASNDPDSPSVPVALSAVVDIDSDGDGVADGADCQPFDPSVFPGNTEIWYDGIDQDCDGRDDDQDQDGYGIATDCDDLNPAAHPDATEIWYNGVDENCDGNDNDQDGDGSPYPTDCDDHNANVSPSQVEIWYDGVDQNCDGNDDDQDGDGYGLANDCNDLDAAVNPGATEVWYDGIDQDCDGRDDDFDNDGYGIASDCNDQDATVNPGATETWYNGVDENCDGKDDDQDGDGYGIAQDCNDLDAAINPSAIEIWYNGVDENCDSNDADQDLDGSDYPADCDDLNPNISPTAIETCNNIDDDCNGVVDDATIGATVWYQDADGDTYGSSSSTLQTCTQPAGYTLVSGDCDDVHATINPAAAEVCDGLDNDCNGGVDDNPVDGTMYYTDADLDGYGGSIGTTYCSAPPNAYLTSTDCNDSNAAINPGASEVCNNTDDNCNGLIDESAIDALTWYRDADADTYGSSATTARSCTQPNGYVADATDCNDGNATVHPSAPELCDNLDNDCNGQVDDNPTNPTTWYVDADGDGYGTSAGSIAACTKPAGYSAVSTDCDDVHASINPAASEVCDSIDNDCDGVVDEDPIDGTRYYRDADADTYGDPNVSVRACSMPSGYVMDNTDCDDTDATVHPGATEIGYDRKDNDCDGRQDEMSVPTTWTVVGTSTSQAIGAAGVTVNADMNNDGQTELIISATADDTVGTDAGAISFHDVGLKGSNVAFSSGYLVMGGYSAGEGFGASPILLGDINGDGTEDMLAGAPGDDFGGTNGGIIWIFDQDNGGSAITGSVNIFNYYDGYITSSSGGFGTSVAVGDFDGDGELDLIGGSPNYNGDGGNARGRALLYDGQDAWWENGLTRNDAWGYARGVSSYDYLGTSMVAGDFDNDGQDDVVICAPYRSTSTGSCYVVNGVDVFSFDDATITNYISTTITGAATYDTLGLSQTAIAAGDLNADGVTDLAIGAPGYDGSTTNGGAVLVLFGGTWGGSYTPTTVSALVTGDGAAGTGINISDVSADGSDDLLVGAPSNGAGTVYLVEGGSTLISTSLPTGQYASWTGETSGDYFGASVGGLIDLDGDGTDDFAATATKADSGSTTDIGKVYVVPGY